MASTFADRKVHTIELLARLEDENLLRLIEQLLLKGDQDDWADNLTEKEQANIAEGIADLESGNTESLESFNARMNEKYQ